MNHTAPAIEPEDYRRLVGFKLLLLAILGVAAFLNSLYGAFLAEDQYRILDNPDVHSLTLSSKAWLGPTRTTDLSLAVNYAISQANPWSYHLLNVALHVLAALALCGVVCRTLIRLHSYPRFQEAAPWLSFLIALLWLAHPLNTETVDYLTRRGELLAGLFYLLTLYCVIRGADGERGLLWYSLAVLACFLGMGSALTMATAPLVVLLYDRTYLAESWSDLWRRRAGLYAGLAVCWVLFAASVVVVGYDPQAIGFNIPGVPPLGYALAQPGVILHDLGLVFWPLGICFDYFDWPLDQSAGSYILPFVVVGALLAATVWALLRWPKIGFVGAWFFLTLAATSGVIPHNEAAGDYRMYLPSAGVAVLAVLAGFALVQWAGERAPWAMYAAVGLALLAVAALGFTSFRRNTDYESAQKIWEDTLTKRPGDAWAHLQLGNIYFQLGNAYVQLKDPEKAKTAFDGAVAAYRIVLEATDAGRNADPRAVARNNLAIALLSANRQDELFQFVAETPGDAVLHAKQFNDFGFILWTNRDSTGAARFFGEAVRLQPDLPKYHFNLALALLDKGDKEQAEVERKKGLELDPDWPTRVQRQAWTKATDADPAQRNALQAIFLARQACQGDSEKHPAPLDALAAAYAAAGRFKEATATAEQARQLAEAEHNNALAREIQERLALYKEQQPFVQK